MNQFDNMAALNLTLVLLDLKLVALTFFGIKSNYGGIK